MHPQNNNYDQMEQLIAQILEEKKRTKADFCARMGVKKQNYVKTTHIESLQRIDKLAAALEMSPKELMCRYYDSREK